ncbi:hypothetical protein SERLA73DRAFT_15140, partial [Serpula lacrymans var. lacrymans S7.3]
PPKAPLTLDQIAEYSFIAEFDLLCDITGKVEEKRWAIPQNCQAACQYFEITRAKEEILCCNIEIARLRT